MDHEVEDHSHVRPARLERREPIDLQEAGLVEIGSSGAHRAIEPLDVAHLEHDAPLPRPSHQLLGSRHRIGERLLHQQCDAAPQHREPHLRMGGRRHGHGHRVHALEQSLERRMGDGLQLL